jgi:hypothetical protein
VIEFGSQPTGAALPLGAATLPAAVGLGVVVLPPQETTIAAVITIANRRRIKLLLAPFGWPLDRHRTIGLVDSLDRRAGRESRRDVRNARAHGGAGSP